MRRGKAGAHRGQRRAGRGGDEVVEIEKVIDGFNRYRFAHDPDLYAAWRSASNVIGPARSGGQADGRTDTPFETPPKAPPSGGEIKPAA